MKNFKDIFAFQNLVSSFPKIVVYDTLQTFSSFMANVSLTVLSLFVL